MKLTIKEMLGQLDFANNHGKCIFFLSEILHYFAFHYHASNADTIKLIEQCVEYTLLDKVTDNVYVNKRASSCPIFLFDALVPYLKPNEFTYLSLESACSNLGIINQIPLIESYVTTGESEFIDCSLGRIEFISTKETLGLARDYKLIDEVNFIKERRVYHASPKLAYHDLVAIKRNLRLVIDEDLADYGIQKIHTDND